MKKILLGVLLGWFGTSALFGRFLLWVFERPRFTEALALEIYDLMYPDQPPGRYEFRENRFEYVRPRGSAYRSYLDYKKGIPDED